MRLQLSRHRPVSSQKLSTTTCNVSTRRTLPAAGKTIHLTPAVLSLQHHLYGHYKKGGFRSCLAAASRTDFFVSCSFFWSLDDSQVQPSLPIAKMAAINLSILLATVSLVVTWLVWQAVRSTVRRRQIPWETWPASTSSMWSRAVRPTWVAC